MRQSQADQGADARRNQDELAADEAIRYLAYLLPSLVHMAETSDRPVLAHLLDMARIEAGEPVTDFCKSGLQ